jgi:hypothetical protein
MRCSRCGKSNDRKRQRYCRSCHAAYQRQWRKTHPLTKAQRRKDNTRSYANAYQRRGVLVVDPCWACGAPNAEKHHPNYDQPLNVVWLCRKCHLGLHAMLRAVSPKHAPDESAVAA